MEDNWDSNGWEYDTWVKFINCDKGIVYEVASSWYDSYMNLDEKYLKDIQEDIDWFNNMTDDDYETKWRYEMEVKDFFHIPLSVCIERDAQCDNPIGAEVIKRTYNKYKNKNNFMMLFELIVDEKVAVWRRSYITVEAGSLEEAIKDCIESGADAATDTLDSEYLFETEECLLPTSEDPRTVEVMDRHFKILGDNEAISR